jgi:hypothetical protein
MEGQKQEYICANEVKNFIKQNDLSFIRNNNRIRKRLNMNKRQLSIAIRHLEKTGYLKPWNKKVFKISNNSN